MTASRPVVGSLVADVIVEERRVLVVLDDGRRLAAPIAWVGPTVAAMNATEQAGWVRTTEGRGVNWPAAGQTSDDGVLDVWTLEQDALFEQGLADLKEAGWDVHVLSPRSRSLVALWRLVADGYNGGLIQLLGNWGVAEVHTALAALAEVGATRTLATVEEFWSLLGPITESAEVTTMDDVYAALSDETTGRLNDIDEAFWDSATELTRLVPLTFGPAPSAI